MNDFIKIAENIRKNASKNEVNLIYPFIQNRGDNKLSIVGEPCRDIITTVDANGAIVEKSAGDYYYGLHPSFDADKIIALLVAGYFADTNAFEKCLTEYGAFFTLPKENNEYARALFAKTLVKMSVMFGFSFKCSDAVVESVNNLLREVGAIKDIDYDITNGLSKELRVLGWPSVQLLSKLDETLGINHDMEIVAKDKATITFTDFYADAKNFSLVQGQIYYSGVMPRLKHIKHEDTHIANRNIDSYILTLERTTFATMDAFDSSYIVNHRLLANYKKTLHKLDAIEDELQSMYLSVDNPDSFLFNINKFLEKSHTAHVIAVSGNISTPSGHTIIVRRNAKTIDSNTYYCSVNGQSEFNDNAVSLYKQSVYEDVPTLSYGESGRIDFLGELSREAEAELDIVIPKSDWTLYGMSFLAVQNNEGNTKRRFHFNILAFATTGNSVVEIAKKQKYAAERFEAKEIKGIKFLYFRNVFFYFLHLVKNFFKGIIKSKNFVTSLLAIILFGLNLKDVIAEDFTFKKFSNIVSILFTILSFLVIAHNIFVYIKNARKNRKPLVNFVIYRKDIDFYKDVHNVLLKRKGIKLHPIADTLLWLVVNENLKS